MERAYVRASVRDAGTILADPTEAGLPSIQGKLLADPIVIG
jgi:hypothetical protein